MGKVISFISHKGGTGKTTLALNITRAFDLDGKKVLLIKSDYKESYFSRRENLSISDPFRIESDLNKIKKYKDEYELVFIDSVSGISNNIGTSDAKKIVNESDLIIIPCTPSPLDFYSAKNTVEMIRRVNSNSRTFSGANRSGRRHKSIFEQERESKEAKKIERQRICLLVTQQRAGTGFTNDLDNYIEMTNLHKLQTTISHRIDYIKSFEEGKTVPDFRKKSKAYQEVEDLKKELEKLLP